MEMKRREFLKLSGLFAVAMVVGNNVLKELLPSDFSRAFKAGKYPGIVKKANMREIVKPGKWAG